jgi:hypothetical protein
MNATLARDAGKFLRAAAPLGVAMLAMLFVGCGGGGSGGGVQPAPPVAPAPPPPPVPPPPPPPPPPADPSTSGTIGPAGGEVAFADQSFKLTIPAGALSNPTTITITDVSDANVPANLQGIDADKVYRLEPSGTQFAVPVQVTAKLPAHANGAISVLAHESNGTSEYVADQGLLINADGRTMTGNITHFTLTLAMPNRSIAVGGEMAASVTLSKTASADGGKLETSTFGKDSEYGFPGSSGPINVTINTPPAAVTFNMNVAQTVTGTYGGTCHSAGTGWVLYGGVIEDALLNMMALIMSGEADLRVQIEQDYQCTGVAPPPPGIPTGTFAMPFGLNRLDGIKVVNGPIGNLVGGGPYAVVAGNQGGIVVNLRTRLSELNWTTGGVGGAALGAPLLGVLPVKQPGDNAPAAFFGFRNNGTSFRHWVQSIGGLGPTEVGNAAVFDAKTVGDDVVADKFLTFSPTIGIQYYRYNDQSQLYQSSSVYIPALRFTGGQLVSGDQQVDNTGVIALSRGHDGNTTSRVWGMTENGSQLEALLTIDDPNARRLECAPTRLANTKWFCGVTLDSGKVITLEFDSENPTAALDPARVQTITTGAGSLGMVWGDFDQGFYAVVTNLDANTINVLEFNAQGVLVNNTSEPAPAECTRPAHVAIATDESGDVAVITCNGTDDIQGMLWSLSM